jgi:hypothetical protein
VVSALRAVLQQKTKKPTSEQAQIDVDERIGQLLPDGDSGFANSPWERWLGVSLKHDRVRIRDVCHRRWHLRRMVACQLGEAFGEILEAGLSENASEPVLE